MLKRFLCLLSLMLLVFTGAQAITIQPTDSAGVSTVRHFNAQSLKNYASNKEFNYSTTKEKDEGGSLLGYLLAKVFEKLFSGSVAGLDLSDLITYGLILFAAVMLVLQVFSIKNPAMFAKNTEQLHHFHIETQNIHAVDFDKLIEEAKAANNYRLAVRMQYLKTLKALSDAGLINWQINKTNFEYYYELKRENMRRQFYALTVVFESVWYGHNEISADEFSDSDNSFGQFLSLIKNRDER